MSEAQAEKRRVQFTASLVEEEPQVPHSRQRRATGYVKNAPIPADEDEDEDEEVATPDPIIRAQALHAAQVLTRSNQDDDDNRHVKFGKPQDGEDGTHGKVKRRQTGYVGRAMLNIAHDQEELEDAFGDEEDDLPEGDHHVKFTDVSEQKDLQGKVKRRQTGYCKAMPVVDDEDEDEDEVEHHEKHVHIATQGADGTHGKVKRRQTGYAGKIVLTKEQQDEELEAAFGEEMEDKEISLPKETPKAPQEPTPPKRASVSVAEPKKENVGEDISNGLQNLIVRQEQLFEEQGEINSKLRGVYNQLQNLLVQLQEP